MSGCTAQARGHWSSQEAAACPECGARPGLHTNTADALASPLHRGPAVLAPAEAVTRSVEERRAIAAHPGTSAEVLRALARDRDLEVRAKVAASTSTDARTLRALARDRTWRERLGWGGERTRLERARVLHAIAANPTCPPDLIAAALDGRRQQAAQAAAANPNCPQGLLRDVALGGPSPLAMAALTNPSLPHDVLDAYFERGYMVLPRVTSAVARNPGTPTRVLARLYASALVTPDITLAVRHRLLELGVAMENELAAHALTRDPEWWRYDRNSPAVAAALAYYPNTGYAVR